jgi:hypothetical protein
MSRPTRNWTENGRKSSAGRSSPPTLASSSSPCQLPGVPEFDSLGISSCGWRIRLVCSAAAGSSLSIRAATSGFVRLRWTVRFEGTLLKERFVLGRLVLGGLFGRRQGAASLLRTSPKLALGLLMLVKCVDCSGRLRVVVGGR